MRAAWILCAAGALALPQFPQFSFQAPQTTLNLNEYAWNTPASREAAQEIALAVSPSLDIWKAKISSLDVCISHADHANLLDIWSQRGLLPNVTTKLAHVNEFAEHQRRLASARTTDILSLLKTTDIPSGAVADPPPRTSSFHPTLYDRYHSWEALEMLLKVIALDAPNLAHIVSLGKTAQGRDITALRVATASDSPKPLFVISGTAHAREWIAAMSTLFFAHSIVDSFLSHSNPSLLRLLDTFDFVFIPVLNVDGYIHSWDHDRLWKKTRQQLPFNFTGIDINMNWDAHWEHKFPPASDSYQGAAPFDAVETLALKSLFANASVGAVVALHSYGQIVSYPYAYTCSEMAPDEENLIEASLVAAHAARMSHGSLFRVGPMCQVAGQQGGTYVDWAYANGVEFPFQVELRDSGVYGFLLPDDQIRPACEETSSLLTSLALFVRSIKKSH